MTAEPRAWRLANAGSLTGPMTTEELVEALRSRRIPLAASAWSEGMPAWVPVTEIPEIRDALGRRGFDAMPRGRLILLGGLSVASGALLMATNVLRALAGHEVSAAWAGLAGGAMAPGLLMLWKAWRRCNGSSR